MANFYCQLDYDHVPYTSPVSPHGTIANNGCGPCSGSMVAENMLGVVFPPEESARFAQECGARDGFGTNLYIYSRAYAKKFGLHLTETEDGMEALRFLQEKRGMVIANVRGDRPEDGHIGVFSDSGHYIVLAAAEGTGVIIALDKKIGNNELDPLLDLVQKYSTRVCFSCKDTERIRIIQSRIPDAMIDYDGNTTEEDLKAVTALVKPENLLVWLYMDKPNFSWLTDRYKVSPESCARVKRYARLGIANINNPCDLREALEYDPDVAEV